MFSSRNLMRIVECRRRAATECCPLQYFAEIRVNWTPCVHYHGCKRPFSFSPSFSLGSSLPPTLENHLNGFPDFGAVAPKLKLGENETTRAARRRDTLFGLTRARLL